MQESHIAIVCASRESGEADRTITLFGPGCGKVTARVRGARKPTSKLAGFTRPFCEGRFFLTTSRSLSIVSGVEILHAHSKVQDDVRKLAVGCYWLELLSSGHWPEDQWEPLFRLTTNALAMLAETHALREIASVVAAKFVKLSGLYPDFANCAGCGTPIHEGTAVIDRDFTCAFHLDCAPVTANGAVAGRRVSAGMVGALYRLYALRLGDFESGWCDEGEVCEIESILAAMLQGFVDCELKTRRFLKDALGW